MAYRLQDLLDVEHLQRLQDLLNEICPFTSAIVDNDGNVLTATAWQDICTRFHRPHQECGIECTKSDLHILSRVAEADPAVTYRCANGLMDSAVPIIVDGHHLANFFTGQFFFEPPDLDYFREQAKRYGFDEAEYLAAVQRVPIWTEPQLASYHQLIQGLIEMVAAGGLKQLRAMEALGQSVDRERQFRAIYEGASIGVAQAEPDTGRWVRVNQRLCEITGYSESELLTMRFSDVTHSEDREHDWGLAQQVVRGERPNYRLEKRYLRKDGQTIWVCVNVAVIRDSEGRPVRTIATIEDITERKERETEVLRLNRLYLALSDINELITRAADEDQLLRGACDILVSRGGLELAWVGWPDPETAEVRPMAQAGAHSAYLDSLVVHADDRPTGRGPTGTAIREDRKVIWNDRRAVPADAVARALPSQHGFASSASFPIADERRGRGALSVYAAESGFFREQEILLFEKAAENISFALQNLRQREERQLADERHRAILQGSVDGFIIADTRGRILEVNEAYCRMSGYAADELLTMHLTDLEAAETPPVVAEHLREMVKAGGARFETQHRRKDGSIFDLEVSIQYRAEEDLLFGFCRDITRRKRAQARREELEAQLAQAQRMEAVGRLAGGVAHDFNNLLTVISGHAELALREVDEGAIVHDDLLTIRQAAQRSADLTRQLLAFARQQTIAPKVLDINATIGSLLRMLQRLIGEDIRLQWVPSAVAWLVKMDPSQLDQILANLCVNARDAIADVGEVTISTGQRSFDEAYCATHAGYLPGDFVSITVQDTGCGMDAQTQEHIFEPFFTTKETGRGTGLGLATVYGAVRQNHGFVRVDSMPGQGSTFTVYLPRTEAEPAGETKRQADEDGLSGDETILLVEDEPAVLRLATRILAKRGYDVIAAGTPGEAIQSARQRTADIRLLITDVIMPEMNGRDLAGEVALLCPSAKVLFMSGYTADTIGHHGVLDPGTAFVQKPFEPTAFLTKVRRVLDGQDPA